MIWGVLLCRNRFIYQSGMNGVLPLGRLVFLHPAGVLWDGQTADNARRCFHNLWVKQNIWCERQVCDYSPPQLRVSSRRDRPAFTELSEHSFLFMADLCYLGCLFIQKATWARPCPLSPCMNGIGALKCFLHDALMMDALYYSDWSVVPVLFGEALACGTQPSISHKQKFPKGNEFAESKLTLSGTEVVSCCYSELSPFILASFDFPFCLKEKSRGQKLWSPD